MSDYTTGRDLIVATVFLLALGLLICGGLWWWLGDMKPGFPPWLQTYWGIR